MRIRDGYARLNGDDTEFVAESDSIEIIGDDGRTLIEISLKDNVFRVDSGHVCKHNNKILYDRFSIQPIAVNCFNLTKIEHTPHSEGDSDE